MGLFLRAGGVFVRPEVPEMARGSNMHTQNGALVSGTKDSNPGFPGDGIFDPDPNGLE